MHANGMAMAIQPGTGGSFPRPPAARYHGAQEIAVRANRVRSATRRDQPTSEAKRARSLPRKALQACRTRSGLLDMRSDASARDERVRVPFQQIRPRPPGLLSNELCGKESASHVSRRHEYLPVFLEAM